jgi:drug/metabolite transporter (DMT)-like permease
MDKDSLTKELLPSHSQETFATLVKNRSNEERARVFTKEDEEILRKVKSSQSGGLTDF